MNVVADSDGTVRVTGLDRLGAANCGDFKQAVLRQLRRRAAQRTEQACLEH